MCVKGKCVSHPMAQTGECLYGDDIITQDLVSLQLMRPQMSCKDFLSYALASDQPPNLYCAEAKFGKACCQSCKSIN